MSALPCGCDITANWICNAHSRVDTVPSSLQRFADRLVAERDMADTVPAQTWADAPEAMLKKRAESDAIDHLIWRNDRRHIADVLATFYRAPLSMSSVQPLLTLAEELNPGLKESKR